MQRGFTLAEVLITLVIIGIIAVMTIPTLIQQQEKNAYVAGLKKAQSTLASANAQLLAEYGSGAYESLFLDDATLGNVALQAMSKYLSIAKNCGTATGCLSHEVKYLRGAVQYSDFDASRAGSCGRAILNDGTSIRIDSRPDCDDIGECATVAVDVNGAKGPNTYGRDIFWLSLYKYKVAPVGWSVADIEHAGADSCVTESNGFYCATRVLRENAMNY